MTDLARADGQPFFAGDTVILTLTVTLNAAAQDITDWTVWFVAKTAHTETDAAAPIFKQTGSGIVHTNAAGGIAQVTIDPADTAAYAATGVTLVWDTQVLTDGGEVYTLDTGAIEFQKAVTRAAAAGPPMAPPPPPMGQAAEWDVAAATVQPLAAVRRR